MTEPTPAGTRGWWARRSRKAKVAIIVVGVLVALSIIGALIPAEETANDASTPAAQEAPAEEEATEEEAEDDGVKTVGVGERLSLKGTSYQVTGRKTAQVLGSGFTEVQADGVFVIVQLTLTNERDDPRTILADNVRLVGGNQKEYSTDTDACLTIEDSLCLLEEIQPDLPKRVVAVYDIPASAVSGAKLRAKDLFSDEYGEIDLAL